MTTSSYLVHLNLTRKNIYCTASLSKDIHPCILRNFGIMRSALYAHRIPVSAFARHTAAG